MQEKWEHTQVLPYKTFPKTFALVLKLLNCGVATQ